MESANPNLQADQELLERFRAGCPNACNQIAGWAREISRIRRFGVAACDHDDIVQETLVHVWRAVTTDGFVLRENLGAFVRKIAAARCIDRIRRIRPNVLLDTNLPDGHDGPLEHVERESERIRLGWILESVSPFCRQLIEMHFMQEMSYGQIAECLHGPKESTLRVHMFNCMKSIRKKLDDTGPRQGQP